MRPRIALLAASLVALAFAPTAAAGEVPPDVQCMWNPAFAQLVYDLTLGAVHLHDGPICTAHVHIPPSGGDFVACAWNPDFADLIYTVSLGKLHPHDGGVCWIHVH